jgi:hypothetical protein
MIALAKTLRHRGRPLDSEKTRNAPVKNASKQVAELALARRSPVHFCCTPWRHSLDLSRPTRKLTHFPSQRAHFGPRELDLYEQPLVLPQLRHL